MTETASSIPSGDAAMTTSALFDRRMKTIALRPFASWMLAGALVLTACASDMDAAAPVMVVDRIGQSLEVTYRVTSAGVEYVQATMELDRGAALQFAFPFDGAQCARGRLVATADGTEIATQDRPNPGGRWEVGPP